MNSCIPYTRQYYLKTKGIENDGISSIDSFPSANDLNVELKAKIAYQKEQNDLVKYYNFLLVTKILLVLSIVLLIFTVIENLRKR